LSLKKSIKVHTTNILPLFSVNLGQKKGAAGQKIGGGSVFLKQSFSSILDRQKGAVVGRWQQQSS